MPKPFTSNYDSRKNVNLFAFPSIKNKKRIRPYNPLSIFEVLFQSLKSLLLLFKYLPLLSSF